MNTKIVRIEGRRIWDSRGRPTVEVDVALESGARGRGIAPAGASRGRHEALESRDGGERLGGFDVSAAVANVNGPIASALAGRDGADQAGSRRASHRARRHAAESRAWAATPSSPLRSRSCRPPQPRATCRSGGTSPETIR